MNQAVNTISQSLKIDLSKLANQIPEKDEFIAQCEAFIASTDSIKPLPFCTHLRKNGFPVVAKAICQFFIQNNPSALTQTLAA